MQVREDGSYRSDDFVEAFDWMLRPAACPEERIIVLLDCYYAHRTLDAEELLLDKGRVRLFHDGRTTPFTQVNDTHLHAAVYPDRLSANDM